MSHKPTLIFVHGSWHTPSTWDKVTSILEKKQYKCIAVSLPSCSSNDPSTTFLDDVLAVRNPIIAETTQGRDVVLVLHSYGGVPGESAVKGLIPNKQDGASTQESTGTGHVIGITVIASGFLPTGLRLLEAFGGKPPPFWDMETEPGFATLVVDPRELFYHDLPVSEGDYWVGKLTKQATRPLTEGEHVYAGWMDVPVWYMVTMQDRTLPVELHRLTVQMARDAGADFTTRDIESSHSPMLSKPEETAQFVVDAVTAFTG